MKISSKIYRYYLHSLLSLTTHYLRFNARDTILPFFC